MADHSHKLLALYCTAKKLMFRCVIVARLSPAHCSIWDLTKRVRISMGQYRFFVSSDQYVRSILDAGNPLFLSTFPLNICAKP